MGYFDAKSTCLDVAPCHTENLVILGAAAATGLAAVLIAQPSARQRKLEDSFEPISPRDPLFLFDGKPYWTPAQPAWRC